MIQVGDNPGGQERVTVQPLSSANVNGPGERRQQITIQFDSRVIKQIVTKGTKDHTIRIDKGSLVA